MRTFSLLPLGVLFVGFEAALRLGVPVEAKQQCRLQLNNNRRTASGTSPIIGTASGTSATGDPPTSTSSGSSTTLPSPTPFNYGTDPIRGVNL
jgi:glucan 1,3-beta-glucosidase